MPEDKAAKFRIKVGISCLMVDEKLDDAIPVGFVHNKDFILNVLVGNVGAAFCVTILL